jgi:hypothetical protein
VDQATAQPDAPLSTTSYQDFLVSLLSGRERLFLDVVDGNSLGRTLWFVLSTIIIGAALYGLSAGAYSSAPQAASAAVKLPLLILATFVICFPAFFVVQVLVGSRLRLGQALVLALVAPALTAVLLAAFIPITVFFLITGANYYFLELLHVGLVLIAGLTGMYALHEGLTIVCEKGGIYPRKALTIMRVWALLFAFVGVQMAWNLRPFLGDRGEPFKVFRHYEGNFYAAIIYSLDKLVKGEDRPPSRASHRTTDVNELLQLQPDTASKPAEPKR